MKESAKWIKKRKYATKLKNLLEEYQTCLIISVNNVGSKQMADIRRELRGRAVVLMGKNTMIRKIIRDHIAESGNNKLENLINIVQGNCGFVFTKESIGDIREAITSNKRQSAAKAGSIAPVDVWVPAGPTGMEPTMTEFFQTLNIATKIMRGQIEITNDVHLIKVGEKVGASEATLLIKLDIRPFQYGIKVQSVYDDGNAYSAEVLDINDNDVSCSFFAGLMQVAALSLAVNYPTVASVPHSVMNAYKKMIGVALGIDGYEWEHLKYVKEVLADPSKFASAGGGGGGGGGGGAGGGAEAKKEEEPSEEESSAAAGGGLFGDSGSDSSS